MKEVNSERSSESPLKVKSAIMEQHWTDLVFIHWRYPVDVVQRLLPEGVEVETYDGDAWIGLIPFNMNDLGFPKWKPLPYVGCLLYTSPSPRDATLSRMPSSA